ncbi:hypothetical protein ACE6H2_000789 [Prunus campanulata]
MKGFLIDIQGILLHFWMFVEISKLLRSIIEIPIAFFYFFMCLLLMKTFAYLSDLLFLSIYHIFGLFA